MRDPKKRDQETKGIFIATFIVSIVVGVAIGFLLMVGAN